MRRPSLQTLQDVRFPPGGRFEPRSHPGFMLARVAQGLTRSTGEKTLGRKNAGAKKLWGEKLRCQSVINEELFIVYFNL